MSPESEMSYQSCGPRRGGGAHWRGCSAGEPWNWKLVEILVMVLGFIVFWPIGLAVIGWKIWQRKSGYQGDLVTFCREWAGRARWAGGQSRPESGWQGYGAASTGNRAFDEWRAAELARLEEERQRLVAAEREFAEFMENLRRARDREEFDRFMNERRNRQGGTA